MASYHDRFTYSELYDYLEAIATKHKTIRSFIERDHDDILKDLANGSNLPAMVVDPPAAVKSDLRSSNTQDEWNIVFEILKSHSTKSSAPTEAKTIISECKQLADDVISYLRNESRSNRLPGFDTANVEGNPIMYTSDAFYGWECRIRIFVPIDLSFKPDKWNL